MTVLGKPYTLSSDRLARAGNGFITRVQTYAGTRESLQGIIANLSVDQAFDLDDSLAPLCTLTLSSPDYNDSPSSDVVMSVYELAGNELQKDLTEHWKLAPYSAETLLAIQEGSVSRTAYSEAQSTITILSQQQGLSSVTPLKFMELYAKGTRSYVVSQYVLRLTQTVSSKTNIQVSFNNVEALYTNNQVLDEIGAPTVILFSVGNIRKQQDDPGDGSILRWLKQTPSVTQIHGGRFQVNLEYVLDYWHDTIYPQAS